MNGKYILGGKQPVEVTNLLSWAKWFEIADRRVKQTEITDDIRVSTVFLSLDHQHGNGPPLLFETMIFGGERDGDMWRYSTWDEAEEGHDRVVSELRGELNHAPSSA